MRLETNTKVSSNLSVTESKIIDMLYEGLPNPNSHQGIMCKQSFAGKHYIFEKTIVKESITWSLIYSH